MERSLLITHLAKERDIRFVETMVIVKALVTVANVLNGAKDSDALNEIINEYKGMMFPELSHELEGKAARIDKMLEKEFHKGPIKVQAQDYDRKRRKRRR